MDKDAREYGAALRALGAGTSQDTMVCIVLYPQQIKSLKLFIALALLLLLLYTSSY